MDETHLCIASYIKGRFNMGMPYFMDLLEQNDIIELQEHRLKDTNMGRLSSISNSFDSVCISAIEHVVTHEILENRPLGDSDIMEKKLS